MEITYLRERETYSPQTVYVTHDEQRMLNTITYLRMLKYEMYNIGEYTGISKLQAVKLFKRATQMTGHERSLMVCKLLVEHDYTLTCQRRYWKHDQ